MSRLLFLVACSIAFMGCILRDFDYDPPANVPPSVISGVDDPFDRVVVVDLDAPVGGQDGGVGSEVQFVATIRDPNIGETLTALIFVDRNRGELSPIKPEATILPDQDDDPIHRRFEFTVPRAELQNAGCHSVELHVSGGFVDFSNPRPAVDGDVGVGVWWVAAVDISDPSVDMTQCASSMK